MSSIKIGSTVRITTNLAKAQVIGINTNTSLGWATVLVDGQTQNIPLHNLQVIR